MTQRHPDEPGYGWLKDKSDAGILAEVKFWKDRLSKTAQSGADVVASLESLSDAKREARLRHLDLTDAGQ